MRLNLEQIPTFVINCAEREDRRESMKRLCADLSLSAEFVDGISCKPRFIGCMLSHLKVLSSPRAIPPFLVLEDDCNVSADFSSVIDVPDEAELFYLGVSNWGIVPDLYPFGIPFAAYARPYRNGTVRLQNILSTHAILYLNQSVIDRVKRVIMLGASAETPFDIVMARLQKDIMVLAPERPYFYQDARIGGRERKTKYPVRCLTSERQLRVSADRRQIKVAWSTRNRSGSRASGDRAESSVSNVAAMPASRARLHAKYESVLRQMRANHPGIDARLKKQREIETTTGYSLKPFDDTRSIFVHVPKTAGVSLAKALYGNLAGGHRTVVDYLIAFGPECFERYFKFAVVRNPWDRLFSAFNFLRSGGFNEADRRWAKTHLTRYSDFKDFVDRGLRTEAVQSWVHFLPQHQFICWPGTTEPLVDYVGYFENLARSVEQVRCRLGIDADLSHENASGDAIRTYRDAYDSRMRAIVADLYSTDIQLFAYDFESSGVANKTVEIPEKAARETMEDVTFVYTPANRSVVVERPKQV